MWNDLPGPIHSIENVEDDGDDHEEYDVKYDDNDNDSNEYWTCTVLLFTVLSLHSVVYRAIKCIIILSFVLCSFPDDDDDDDDDGDDDDDEDDDH